MKKNALFSYFLEKKALQLGSESIFFTPRE